MERMMHIYPNRENILDQRMIRARPELALFFTYGLQNQVILEDIAVTAIKALFIKVRR
jgi:hypothetical protein